MKNALLACLILTATATPTAALVCRLIPETMTRTAAGRHATFRLRDMIVSTIPRGLRNSDDFGVEGISIDGIQPFTICDGSKGNGHSCTYEEVTFNGSARGPNRVQMRIDTVYFFRDIENPAFWYLKLNRVWLDEHQSNVRAPTYVKSVEEATALYDCV